MNILIDYLPTEFKNLKISVDFRTSILFELLMQDNNLSKEQKIYKALELYYPNQNITNIKDAFDGIIWFYKCGKEKLASGQNTEQEKEVRKQIYSYEFDANYIYSAFMEQYGIDLNEIRNLHWWKFKAMFDGLKEDTMFVKIMGYRAVNINNIKDKEQQKRYKKLQDIYSLPDLRSEEEKENDFADNLW